METIINLKLKPERFVIHFPDLDIHKIENLARKTGCTKSWVIRSILTALQKKFPGVLEVYRKIHRPRKFDLPFRQMTVCFYGDKKKWMSLTRIWKVELGPLIRYGWDLYLKGELELDLESSTTVKEAKSAFRGKKSRNCKRTKNHRYIYRYQNESVCYQDKEFWKKNSEGNIFLMEWGLANRIYPLIL